MPPAPFFLHNPNCLTTDRRASRWPEAATAYNDIFDGHSGAAADTTEAGRRDLLRLAIASSLSGDVDKLDALHARFSTTLQGTDYAEAFDLITRSSMSGDVPYRELPKVLAHIDGAEKFMASYRDWSQSSTASDSGAVVN